MKTARNVYRIWNMVMAAPSLFDCFDYGSDVIDILPKLINNSSVIKKIITTVKEVLDTRS